MYTCHSTGIEERIAMWTMLPLDHGEGLQVLRYRGGEKYDAHYDYFSDSVNIKNGGNRVATVLMYLADTEEGGETVRDCMYNLASAYTPPCCLTHTQQAFPNVPAAAGADADFSDCARPFLAARPRKGDAILFHSMTPEGLLERGSLHVACPVIKGEKWSAAKWIHARPFETADAGMHACRWHVPQQAAICIPKKQDAKTNMTAVRCGQKRASARPMHSIWWARWPSQGTAYAHVANVPISHDDQVLPCSALWK